MGYVMREPSEEDISNLRTLISSAKAAVWEVPVEDEKERCRQEAQASALEAIFHSICSGTYPRTYIFLPEFRGALHTFGSETVYACYLKLTTWYFQHYRVPDASVQRRLCLIAYLVATQNCTEQDAFQTVCRAAADGGEYEALCQQASKHFGIEVPV